MVFSSLPFLFLFLTVVLLVSHILPFRFRNFFLLLANLVFYAYGEPVYVLIMIGSILVNFFAGLLMDKQSTQGRRRAVLVVGIVLNLAALGVFKYAGLFVSTLREIPGLSSLPEVDIALPIGISFYTFQAVSYLIDVYWDDCAASHNLINFASYISQLIAGPIVRYKDVNEQLVSRRETPTLFNSGVRLFVVGLAKKVLLANQFGMLWDAMSADPVAAGALGAWAGACAYTLQIYFDFAGYSDMARGLGRMLGFEFCINFNYPYISKSVTEFWRRWHISLSTWFRDYVYIPLGGNRCGKLRQCVNILVVWALTGFWHGAGWNFLFWGFYYGVLLLLEKLLLGKYIRRLPAVFQHCDHRMGVLCLPGPVHGAGLPSGDVLLLAGHHGRGFPGDAVAWYGGHWGGGSHAPGQESVGEAPGEKSHALGGRGALSGRAAPVYCQPGQRQLQSLPVFPVLRGGTYCEKIVFLFAGADLPGISGGHGPSAAVLPGAGLLGE